MCHHGFQNFVMSFLARVQLSHHINSSLLQAQESRALRWHRVLRESSGNEVQCSLTSGSSSSVGSIYNMLRYWKHLLQCPLIWPSLTHRGRDSPSSSSFSSYLWIVWWLWSVPGIFLSSARPRMSDVLGKCAGRCRLCVPWLFRRVNYLLNMSWILSVAAIEASG